MVWTSVFMAIDLGEPMASVVTIGRDKGVTIVHRELFVSCCALDEGS